jgi:carbon monoxide dehydrogenase subunit G
MRIRADFGVGHPAAEVWALLSSPDGAGCVPGLSIEGSAGGSLGLDVEARHLVFDGTAAVASDPRARTVTIEVKGTERGGRGRARSTLLLRVEEDGLFSTVNVEADLHLSGEIASESRLIAEQAYRLADRVAECLEERLGPGRPAAGPDRAPAAEPTAAAEPGRPVGWLRRWFRRDRA